MFFLRLLEYVWVSNYLDQLVFKAPWTTGNLVWPTVIVSLALKSTNAKRCQETANKLYPCVFPLHTYTGVYAHVNDQWACSSRYLRLCVCGLNIYLLKDRWICQEWWKSFCQPLPPLPPVVFTDWMQSAVRHARDHFIRVQHVLDDEEIWEQTLPWNLPLAERLLCVVGTGCSWASAGFADRTYSNMWCKLLELLEDGFNDSTFGKLFKC